MLLVTQFMHRLMRDDRIELAEPNGPCDVFEVHEQLSSAPDVWPHLFARQMMHGRREIEHCVFGGRDRVQNAASPGSQVPIQVPRSVGGSRRATAAPARFSERSARAMAASTLPKQPIAEHLSRCGGQSGLGHRET